VVQLLFKIFTARQDIGMGWQNKLILHKALPHEAKLEKIIAAG